MENIDLIVLTAIISVLFLVFIIATFREFSESNKTPFKGGKEKGIRADMIQFVGRIFTDEKIDPKEKRELLSIVKKTLSEMESNEESDNTQV